jgi:hypothetical protein
VIQKILCSHGLFRAHSGGLVACLELCRVIREDLHEMAQSRELFKGNLLREPRHLEAVEELEGDGESVRTRRIAGRPILDTLSIPKQPFAHA